jgi:hypothetical protein
MKIVFLTILSCVPRDDDSDHQSTWSAFDGPIAARTYVPSVGGSIDDDTSYLYIEQGVIESDYEGDDESNVSHEVGLANTDDSGITPQNERVTVTDSGRRVIAIVKGSGRFIEHYGHGVFSRYPASIAEKVRLQKHDAFTPRTTLSEDIPDFIENEAVTERSEIGDIQLGDVISSGKYSAVFEIKDRPDLKVPNAL